MGCHSEFRVAHLSTSHIGNCWLNGLSIGLEDSHGDGPPADSNSQHVVHSVLPNLDESRSQWMVVRLKCRKT